LFLQKSCYTISNALLWGNCAAHFTQGSLCLNRSPRDEQLATVHFAIALIEMIPIIGQIVSLIEMVVARDFFAWQEKKGASNQLDPFRVTSQDVKNAQNFFQHLEKAGLFKEEEENRKNANILIEQLSLDTRFRQYKDLDSSYLDSIYRGWDEEKARQFQMIHINDIICFVYLKAREAHNTPTFSLLEMEKEDCFGKLEKGLYLKVKYENDPQPKESEIRLFGQKT